MTRLYRYLLCLFGFHDWAPAYTLLGWFYEYCTRCHRVAKGVKA